VKIQSALMMTTSLSQKLLSQRKSELKLPKLIRSNSLTSMTKGKSLRKKSLRKSGTSRDYSKKSSKKKQGFM